MAISPTRRMVAGAAAIFILAAPGGIGGVRQTTAAAPLLRAASRRPVVTLGQPVTLLPSGRLGLDYFPDMPVVVLRRKPRVRLLVTAGVSTYLVEGADIERLERAEKVLSPGPPGSFDNGYVGAAGAYRDRKGTWYAFYHAEDHEGMPGIGQGIPGFYCSIGAALSQDDGRTWRKVGQIITSARPKEWTAYSGQADRGVGSTCFATDPTGKFLYCYYTDHSRVEGRGVQICMARATLPPAPGSWRKLCDSAFTEPALGGKDTPVISAKDLDGADAIMPSVVYLSKLRVYAMVLNVDCWKELAGDAAPTVSGVYVCYSQDGIHYSELEKLFNDWAIARIGRSVSWHPSIVMDPGSTRQGWLIYGHSDAWGHRANGSGTPHYMVGRRIAFH